MESHCHPTNRKSRSEMVSEWEELSDLRAFQIRSGVDITFNRVLLPVFRSLLTPLRCKQILDVGCGTGDLLHAFDGQIDTLVGIDPSKRNVDHAKELKFSQSVAHFYVSSIEEYVKTASPASFDTAVSNMVLMN